MTSNGTSHEQVSVDLAPDHKLPAPAVPASASASSKAAAVAANGSARMGGKPTLINRGGLRFLIMDAPRSQNLHLYIKECKRHNVTDIVRVCEPTYGSSDLAAAGIGLHEMAYDDGTSPPSTVISQWLDLVEERLVKGGAASGSAAGPCIAVHCVAGLGRAPVLVALALIEFAQCDPIMAVDFIRKHRRGAINNKQLQYLEGYRRQGRGGCGCVIM
jgi:protein tyrosine phosphatase type 4A